MSQNCNCDCCCKPVESVTLPVTGFRLPGLGMGIDVDASVLKGQGGKCAVNLDLYVATTGNDANDGLTPATAFATVHRAVDYLKETCFKHATVNIADGEYEGDRLLVQDIGQVIFSGQSRTGTNLRFTFRVTGMSAIYMENLSLSNDTSAANIGASANSAVALCDVDLQSSKSQFIIESLYGAHLNLSGTVNCLGTPTYFIGARLGSSMEISGSMSINGSCTGTLYSGEASYLQASYCTFSGSVSGKRHVVTLLSG